MAEAVTPTTKPLPSAAKSPSSNTGKSNRNSSDSRKRKFGDTSRTESTNTSKQIVDNGSADIAPKPKKRKPSAIRDFPPGCGRCAAPVTLIPFNDETQQANNKHSAEVVNENEKDIAKVSSIPSPLVASAALDQNIEVSSSPFSPVAAAAALSDKTKLCSVSSPSHSLPVPPLSAAVNDTEGDNPKEFSSPPQTHPHIDAANDNETDNTKVSPYSSPSPAAAANDYESDNTKVSPYSAPSPPPPASAILNITEVSSSPSSPPAAAAIINTTEVSSSPSSPPAAYNAEMNICHFLTEASSPSTPLIEFPPTPVPVKCASHPVSALRDFPFGCGPNAPPMTREECLKAVAALHTKSSHTPKSSQQKKRSLPNAAENGMSSVDKVSVEAVVPLAVVPGNILHEDNINTMDSLADQQSPTKIKTLRPSMPNGKIESDSIVDKKLDNLQDGQESMDSQGPSRSLPKPKSPQTSEMNGKIASDHSIDKKPKTKAFPEHDGPVDWTFEDKSKTKISNAHYGSGDQTINKKPKKNFPSAQDGAGDFSTDRKMRKASPAHDGAGHKKLKVKASPPHDGAGHKKLKTKSSPPHDGAGDSTIDNKLKTKTSPAHDAGSGKKNSKDQAVNFALVPYDGTISNAQGQSDGDGTVTRSKVRETMRLFQVLYRKFLQEEETHTKGSGQANTRKRPDVQASQVLKENNKWVNTGKQIVGPVPGVEVGDEFHYRIELCIVGLHRQSQGGIDYLKQGNTIIATSVVASGAYADDIDTGEVLIYTGQGGNNSGMDKKQAEDQKLERGNLSLKNCIDENSPVRVIRGLKESKSSFGAKGSREGSKSKAGITYTYDGLYLVEKYWQEKGTTGSSVFKFQLRRMPGQPQIAWNILRTIGKSKTLACREGLRQRDISHGKETRPISVVNTVDDEIGPAPFEYTSKIIYPSWYNPTPPRGCDCVDGCSDSESCFCAIKNGGELPYNYNGAIVEAKPLVHECGPFCKCPQTCHNRVSQHGVKLELEVFKTAKRGWGVRSLTSISSGSFICEYTGELLSDMEAEQRTGNDEYLFDIGSGSNDQSLWDGLAGLVNELPSHSIVETVEDSGYTIDAAKYGGVGRFINHSCSPNLYAQNVLYDHDDKTVPHIMLFAAENIPPLQELSYHYNYKLDQVRDSDGNIKKKSCYCGSAECTGRLY
eukprot:PITA_00618